jgi:hypothetical protein
MYQETYYPTRRYEVQMIVPDSKASFDELAGLAKDRLRDADGSVLKAALSRSI